MFGASFSKLSKNMLLGVIIFGLFMTMASAISGYFIGSSLTRFKTNDRTISVKGLVERTVQSDYAVWTIPFEANAETLQDARSILFGARTILKEFLTQNGFTDKEIAFETTAVTDRKTGYHDKNQEVELRYGIEGKATISTERLPLLLKVIDKIDEVIQAGVVLKMDRWNTKPQFFYTKFSALRPEMLREAAQNAQQMAAQFSKDTGAKIGALRQASQGQFQIFGKNTANEYDQTQSYEKVIRVVSTLQFDIEK